MARRLHSHMKFLYLLIKSVVLERFRSRSRPRCLNPFRLFFSGIKEFWDQRVGGGGAERAPSP